MSEALTPGRTIIKSCVCASPFQDAVYGKGLRVHNVGKRDANGRQDMACTVCKPNRFAVRMREHGRQFIKGQHG